MPEDVVDSIVEVPSVPCPLTDSDYAEMCANINPLAISATTALIYNIWSV